MPREKTIPHVLPCRGWSWRGARLACREIAAYLPGERMMHLGVARARLDREMDFPVLFRVYAHEAWMSPGSPDEVMFPPDTEFLVRDVQGLPDGRTALHLEQAIGASAADPERAAEFAAWLPKVARSLPEPDPALERLWDAPFARWARGARKGDAPMVGTVHESEAMDITLMDEGGPLTLPVHAAGHALDGGCRPPRRR